MTIVREIGRGGAGIVYLARDESLDRLIALKILHRDAISGDANATERFRNEGLIAAKLEHPAIIPIYATGIARGRMFITMRYVPGRSLASYIDENAPLPAAAAIRLLRPVASALDYAADFQIVHRDVKPANIFIDESSSPPRTLLGDFGIARAHEGTRHTVTGGWVGTPEYIAPEILKDEQATSRADQYSLACVLVECITGVSPFKRSNTAATMTAQVTEHLDLEATSLSDAAAEAILIALAKNPHDRYQSCMEMLDVVEASLMRGEGATPNTIVRRRKRSKIRRRGRIAATIIVAVIGLGLGVAQIADFNLRSWISGGAAAEGTTTASTPPVSGGSEPQSAAAAGGGKGPDVLILGSTMTEDTWRFRVGVTAPEVVQTALADNPETLNLRTVIWPLKNETACAIDLQRAAQRMPTTAIVVLETPCAKQVIKTFGTKDVDAPTIYWLSEQYKDLDAARAFVKHPASLAYPDKDPAIITEYGAIAGERFVPIQLATRDFFEAGVLARQLGQSSCTLVLSKDLYGEELYPGVFDTGLAGSNNDASAPTPTITPNDLSTASDLGDCVAITMLSSDLTATTGTAIKRFLSENPNGIVIFILGIDKAFKKAWCKKQQRCYEVAAFTWLPNDVPQRINRTVGEAMFQNWSGAYLSDSRAPLLFIDEMIASQVHGAKPGTIAAEGWVAADESNDPKTSSVVSYPSVGVEPTPWGFVSGYNTSIWSGARVFDLVGGTIDPDWPELLPTAPE